MRHWHLLSKVLVVILMWLVAKHVAAFQLLNSQKQHVPLYIYHLKPPYVVDLEQEQGLYFDYAKALNRHAVGFDFYVIYVPKKRIEKLLSEQRIDGAVLGVNPKWFNDAEESKYHWTQALVVDSDDFISLKSDPVEVSGVEKLHGLTLAGVAGFFYAGLQE